MLTGPLLDETQDATTAYQLADNEFSSSHTAFTVSELSRRAESVDGEKDSLGGLVGTQVDELSESLQKTHLNERETATAVNDEGSKVRSLPFLSGQSSYNRLRRQIIPNSNGESRHLSTSLPSNLYLSHLSKTPDESKTETKVKPASVQGRPLSHFNRRQQQLYSSYSPASPLRMSADQHLQMRLSTSRNLLGKQVNRTPSTDYHPPTINSATALSKRINLRVKTTKNRPRSTRNGPLCKLSVNLVQTYMKINESYFAAEARRKRSLVFMEKDSTKLANPPPTSSTVPDQPLAYEDANNDYIVRPGEIWNDRFQIVKLLGKGSFGQVVEAVSKSNEKVAIKIIKNKRAFYNQAQVEIKIVEFLNRKDDGDSKSIVKMKEHFMHRNHLCLVYELLSINLYELLHATQFNGLSLSLVREFAKQILTALKFLARPDIKVIHCDLKPENILLREPDSEKIKVIDFGSSCFHSERVYSYIQSRFYRSPEIILGYPYTVQIDIWSLGCILVELLCGEPLFPGQNEHDQLCRICDVLGSIPPDRLIEESLATKIGKFFLPIRDYNAGVTDKAGASASMSSAKWRLIPNAGFRPSGKTVKDIVLGKATRCLSDLIKPTQVPPEESPERHDSNPKPKPSEKSSDMISDPSSPSLTDYHHFIELVLNMLQFHPSDRISAEEASQHCFFTENTDLGCNTELTGLPEAPPNRTGSAYSVNYSTNNVKLASLIKSPSERSPSVAPSLYESDSPSSILTYKLMSGRNVGVEKRNIGIQSASSTYPRFNHSSEGENKTGGMATSLLVESSKSRRK